MSYFRRGLSGVQSQPQGGRVARGALGGVQSRPHGGRIAKAALGATVTEYAIMLPKPPPPPPSKVMASRGGGRVGPRWFRQMQGAGSLGVDTTEPIHTLDVPTLSEPNATTQFRSDLLAANRALVETEKERMRKEELRGFLQIGATLMIPVAAAIWKALGIGKKKVSAP